MDDTYKAGDTPKSEDGMNNETQTCAYDLMHKIWDQLSTREIKKKDALWREKYWKARVKNLQRNIKSQHDPQGHETIVA